MTDFSKLSDEQINTAVAMALGEKAGEPVNGMQLIAVDGEYLSSSFDPCNSWADVGPIAEKSRIGTIPSSGGTHMAWDISGGLLGDKQAHSEKICRAICIVFLMMNEGE